MALIVFPVLDTTTWNRVDASSRMPPFQGHFFVLSQADSFLYLLPYEHIGIRATILVDLSNTELKYKRHSLTAWYAVRIRFLILVSFYAIKNLKLAL